MINLSHGWNGFLNADNIDDVADALRRMLNGKTFFMAFARPKTGVPYASPSLKLSGERIVVKKGNPTSNDFKITLHITGHHQQFIEVIHVRDYLSSRINKDNGDFVEITKHEIRIRRFRSGSLENVLIGLQ